MSSRSPSPFPEEKEKKGKKDLKTKRHPLACRIISLVPVHMLTAPIEIIHTWKSSTDASKSQHSTETPKKRKLSPNEKSKKKPRTIESDDESDDEDFKMEDSEGSEDDEVDEEDEDDCNDGEDSCVLQYDGKEYTIKLLKKHKRRSSTPLFVFGPSPESNKRHWFGLCYTTHSNIRIAIVPDKTSLFGLQKPTTFAAAVEFLCKWKDGHICEEHIYDWPILSPIEMNSYRLLIQQPENWRRIGRLVQLTSAIGIDMCSMTDLIYMFLTNEAYSDEITKYFQRNVVKAKDTDLSNATTLAEVLYAKSKFFAPNAMISFRK